MSAGFNIKIHARMTTMVSAMYPFSDATGERIRVRFCPSPTGTPHVGLIRTALFNWAYARHSGGAFVFRIEDTDEARDSEESYQQLLDALQWLGLNWDEGVEVGGPHAPYRQSQRSDIYEQVIEKLFESGHIYESYATAEEIEARNVSMGRSPQRGYDNFERDLTDEQRAEYKAQGRQPALRLRVPDEDITFTDLVRSEVTFPAGSFADFVVVRPNGKPLYTFVNPLDDALMGITDVLRGEDLLSSTPRQIVLYRALINIGITTFIPRFGHLPYVMGEGNKKLSKRDPESNLFHHKQRGMIPEGLLNYLALLGWSISHDRDIFSQQEMIEAFDVHTVNPNPARFDLVKAESMNGEHIRRLSTETFVLRCEPYLHEAGLVDSPMSESDKHMFTAIAPLVQERVFVLGQVAPMVEFLFVSSDRLVMDPQVVKGLAENAVEVLLSAVAVLEHIDDASWSLQSVETALRTELIGMQGLKPRFAFAPLRVAMCGQKVSPPLFESLELLGKEETLARFDALVLYLGQTS